MTKLPAADASEKQETVNNSADFIRKPVYDFFKRAFDVISSLIGSIVLILPMAAISLAITAKDKGKPLYFHKRVGMNGEEIKVCKFRSMKLGADELDRTLTPEQLAEYKREYKIKDDPRLIGYKNEGDGQTCFGAVLRRMSLDELPQIFYNILIKGNMSVIGPRPILKSELEEHYTPCERRLLLSVKPGLTGYWQAYGRNNIGYADGKRQKMELFYVHNRSVLLDIRILVKTVEAVFFGKGAK
ncbi:MAG: sugar transferase [Ruminococcus sp.]|nr:sugar transferase [Ruminococcus sp.]